MSSLVFFLFHWKLKITCKMDTKKCFTSIHFSASQIFLIFTYIYFIIRKLNSLPLLGKNSMSWKTQEAYYITLGAVTSSGVGMSPNPIYTDCTLSFCFEWWDLFFVLTRLCLNVNSEKLSWQRIKLTSQGGTEDKCPWGPVKHYETLI